MKIQLTLDEAGLLVIPKLLFDQLSLGPGDTLGVESAGEVIHLRPLRGTGQLRQELGVWVLQGQQSLSASATDDMLQLIRDERELGSMRCER